MARKPRRSFSLTEAQDAFLKEGARRRGVDLAEQLRFVLDRYMEAEGKANTGRDEE